MGGTLGSSVDDGGVLVLLRLHQGIVGQLVGVGVVIDIGIASGNVPGGDHIAQVLEGALDLLVISVAVAEGTVTIGRTHVAGDNTEDVLESLLELGHLEGDAIGGQLGKLGVGPGVGGDLVARVVGALKDGLDLGVVDALLVVSVDEEGDLDVLLVEEVQQPVGVLFCCVNRNNECMCKLDIWTCANRIVEYRVGGWADGRQAVTVCRLFGREHDRVHTHKKEKKRPKMVEIE